MTLYMCCIFPLHINDYVHSLYRYQQSNGYLPRPLDLSVVIVPEDLTVLVEMLAENNHNVWAMERIKAGWKYGSASVSDPTYEHCTYCM